MRTGALALAEALAYMPPAVHLAVVDPGVGAEGPFARAAVAVRCADSPRRLLVGPDNGLLAPALERFGGALDAVEITHSKERLEPLSRTFHGRDLFAPVAAALAAGEELAAVGEPFPPEALVRLELTRAEYRDGGLAAHVLRCDRFGNLVLDAAPAEVEVMTWARDAEVLLRVGARERYARLARAFADVPRGELLVYEDSSGALAIAANGASAAELLQLRAGGEVLVLPL